MPDGPLHPCYGPYVRNAQPVPDTTLFIGDACSGVKGQGKVWFIILFNTANQPCGSVKRRKNGRFQVSLHVGSLNLSAMVNTEAEGIYLLTTLSKEFSK